MLALVSGCVVVPPAVIEKPQHLRPIQSQPEASKLVFVTNVSTQLTDKKIGQMKAGTLCVDQYPLVWNDNPAALNAIKHAISTTLSKNGYDVYSGLIQDRGERDADVLVGVGIEDIKANMCYSMVGTKGEASMRLKFEVFNNKTRSSFTRVAAGSGLIAEFDQSGDAAVFVKAAEMATNNLLADDAFFEATRK
jgi:hypothetical protein